MPDLKKLEKMLDAAMEQENVDSLNAWLDEERRKDMEAGLYVIDQQQIGLYPVEDFDISRIIYENPYTRICETTRLSQIENAITLAA